MATGQQAEPQPAALMDPVCGMPVPDGPEALRATFDQVTYAFCSGECRRRFLAHPERYVSSLSFEPGRHAGG